MRLPSEEVCLCFVQKIGMELPSDRYDIFESLRIDRCFAFFALPYFFSFDGNRKSATQKTRTASRTKKDNFSFLIHSFFVGVTTASRFLCAVLLRFSYLDG